jgi:inosine/xanthosine triphosphatase
MQSVIVASTNPVKLEVAKRAFEALFPGEEFEYVAVQSESGVPDQPFEQDTLKGAENRLAFVMREHPQADYWISQEGGLFADGKRLYNMAWIAVRRRDGARGEAATARMYIPKEIARMVLEGKELGHAGNEFFNETNIKHGNGIIGRLTNGTITRTDYYEQAAILALGQIVHREWYE